MPAAPEFGEMTMSPPPRLRAVCCFFALFCWAGAISIALFLLLLPAFHGHIEAEGTGSLSIASIMDEFTLDNGWGRERRAEAEAAVSAWFAERPGQAVLLALAIGLSALPYAAALVRIAQVLHAITHGQFFTADCITRLRSAAVLLLTAILLAPLSGSLAQSIYAQALTGFGDFRLVHEISIGTGLITPFFFAALAWIIAWVLDEGRRLREETEDFV